MPALIDLDKLAPTDREIKLGGKRYRVPGDPPAEWYLRLTQLASGDAAQADEATQLRHLQDVVVDLVAFRHPDVAKENTPAGKALRKALGQLGLLTSMQVVGTIYADLADDKDEPDPQKPSRKAGTRSTSRNGTSRSRRST